MATGVQSWSQTAATNASADSTVNFAEGQAPSTVNDSARALMASVAKYRDDTAGTLTTGGTSTAYTLTSNQNFTTLALMSGAELAVKFNATNGAAPTLAVDGLAAKAINVSVATAVGTGVILANSIWNVTYDNSNSVFILRGVPARIQDATVTATSLASDAVTTVKILDANVTAAKLAANAVTAASVASSFMPFAAGMLNGTIVESHAANAVTFAIKTLAGADPSASDPVQFIFRDATIGTGDYVVRSVTAALSLVISSGSTMGFSASTPGRIWLMAIDNGGSVALGAVNCLNGINIFPLNGWGIISTSAEGGIGGADSAAVVYSSSALTSKAYIPLGYATWDTGGTLATAGTWGASPTRIQIYGPGVPLPGAVIQNQRTDTSTLTTGSTTIPNDNTIPQITEGNEYMTQAITPTSGANLLQVRAQGHFGNNLGAGGSFVTMALFQDTTAGALSAITQLVGGSDGTGAAKIFNISKRLLSALITSTTFRVRAGGTSGTVSFNGSNGSQFMGGVMNSYIEAEEIMA